MSQAPSIDPRRFVAAVQPLLQQRDTTGLLALLKRSWSCEQIAALLNSPDTDTRKVAALALSLVGEPCCIKPLANLLKDADPVVNQMAEHALWSIWFRGGCTDDANQQMMRGVQAMGRGELQQAVEHFDRAITASPDFAEAYNQRAIAWYLLEEFDRSIEDCRVAVRLMPCHFGAWSGMGHSFVNIGQLRKARECYQQALAINPHLECIGESIRELDAEKALEN